MADYPIKFNLTFHKEYTIGPYRVDTMIFNRWRGHILKSGEKFTMTSQQIRRLPIYWGKHPRKLYEAQYIDEYGRLEIYKSYDLKCHTRQENF